MQKAEAKFKNTRKHLNQLNAKQTSKHSSFPANKGDEGDTDLR